MTAYTDLIAAGDQLIAIATDDQYSKFGSVQNMFKVISRDYAVRVSAGDKNGKRYKINRRGNDARVFVGNFKVIGRL